MKVDLIVIGASWGGFDATAKILCALPAGFTTPIAIAQHRGEGVEDRLLEDTLQKSCKIPVVDVHHGQPIEPGHVYLAPPEYHLIAEEGRFAVSTDDVVEFARPSVDVLFDSAADAYGARVIGVMLTGAGRDGAAGLRRIFDRGGWTIVQDPESAERPSMPEAAIGLGAAREVLPLDEIASRLVDLCDAEPAA